MAAVEALGAAGAMPAGYEVLAAGIWSKDSAKKSLKTKCATRQSLAIA